MILSGAIASSAGGFVATGGTVYTNNGYKYHVFTASGTFSASGEKIVHVLTINGGASGGTGYTGSDILGARGGNGGAGGNALIGPTTAPFSGNMTVTVGAAGGTSSVSATRSTTSISGGTGGAGGRIQWNHTSGYWEIPTFPGSGGNVNAYSTRGNPWTQIPLDAYANSGGGGGNVSGNNFADNVETYLDPGGAGFSGFVYQKFGGGGGAGGDLSSGGNAIANSGGGGGGGAATVDMYGNFYYGGSSYSGGSGGSGIVIIAYQEG